MQKPLLIFLPLMDPVLLGLKPEDFAGHHILPTEWYPGRHAGLYYRETEYCRGYGWQYLASKHAHKDPD